MRNSYKSIRNELRPDLRINKEDSLTNDYHDRIIGLTHRQGLTGVFVKLPNGAFIQPLEVLSGLGKGGMKETFQVYIQELNESELSD